MRCSSSASADIFHSVSYFLSIFVVSSDGQISITALPTIILNLSDSYIAATSKMQITIVSEFVRATGIRPNLFQLLVHPTYANYKLFNVNHIML